MARKAFVVTEATREKVRYLAGVGVPQDDIAKIVGCAPKTLRKRLRDELDRGVAEANATVSGYLFAAAKAGNIAAIIFWLKTRANWRERRSPDEPIPATSSEANSNVVLVLPDNSRDPELTQVLQSAQEEYYSRKRKRQRARAASNLTVKPKIAGPEKGPVQTDHEHQVDNVGQNSSQYGG
jgi:hypothetical protein